MGQYHDIVNLSKREFLHAHKLGCGLKLVEQANTDAGTLQALFAALACSNGRGGGDFIDHEWVGRWKGDQIAVIGDYATNGDLAKPHEQVRVIRAACHEDGKHDGDHEPYPCFEDVSDLAADFLEKQWRFKFSGEGWRNRKYMDGHEDNPGMAPDIVVGIPRPPG